MTDSWSNYLSNITWRHADSVRTVWHNLTSICPNIKIPRAGLSPSEESFFFMWDNGSHYLDLEIYPDSTMEWFYRNRDEDSCDGSEEPSAMVDSNLLEYLANYAT